MSDQEQRSDLALLVDEYIEEGLTKQEAARRVIESFTGRELTKLIAPHLETMIAVWIGRQRKLWRPSSIAGTGYDTSSGNPADVGALSDPLTKVWVDTVGYVPLCDLTPDHCLLIAGHQRRLAITYVATAEQFETWATQMRDGGYQTFGEMQNAGTVAA